MARAPAAAAAPIPAEDRPLPFTAVDARDVVERSRVLSKEQIAVLADRPALVGLQADYEDQSIAIEVMLEYPDDPRDPEWYARTRGALIVHRIGAQRCQRRIKQIDRENERATRLARQAAE